MSRKVTYLIVLFTLLAQLAGAQELAVQLPLTSGESLVLYSDREIYGAGEQIHYYASYKGPEGLESLTWSTVLYVELISWNGNKQASSKVQIDNGRADIPPEKSENTASE